MNFKIFNLLAFFTLFWLNIFDTWSTILLLSKGFNEANPIMRFTISYLGIISGILIPKTIAFLILFIILIFIQTKKDITKQEKYIVITGYIIMISFYSYVMFNYNYKMMCLFIGDL